MPDDLKQHIKMVVSTLGHHCDTLARITFSSNRTITLLSVHCFIFSVVKRVKEHHLTKRKHLIDQKQIQELNPHSYSYSLFSLKT